MQGGARGPQDALQAEGAHDPDGSGGASPPLLAAHRRLTETVGAPLLLRFQEQQQQQQPAAGAGQCCPGPGGAGLPEWEACGAGGPPRHPSWPSLSLAYFPEVPGTVLPSPVLAFWHFQVGAHPPSGLYGIFP